MDEGHRGKENLILEKSFNFAIRVIRLYQYLTREHKEFILSKQVLRSGTSIGANVEEAMAASSKRDFIAKLDIAAKEARETSYFLRLLFKTDYLPKPGFESIYAEAESIKKILSSIILTTRKNLISPTPTNP
ncbi:four helix bundle protein [soil metagenome]